MARELVTVRVSAQALARILAVAAEAGVTQSEVVRLMLAYGERPAHEELRRAAQARARAGVELP